MGVQLPSEPITRKEQYLAKAAGQAVEVPAEPITREEAYLDAIAKGSGGGGGTSDYSQLTNKPQINGTTLTGNKSASDLSLATTADLAGKVDKEEGYGLSENDYTDTDKAIVGGVTAALAGKQNALTAGKYIDIDANNEISVDPVVPNEAFTYLIEEPADYTLHVTKSVDGVVVFEETYVATTWEAPIDVTLDNAIRIYTSLTGIMFYELIIASDTHDAGFKQNMQWFGRGSWTETFSTVDHSGEKLITKSELDTALATKADLTDLAPAFSSSTAYTVGQYVSYDGNIYKCTSAHSAGAWAAGDFTLVAVGSELESKQDATDNSLQTADKTVVGAVNELKSGLTNLDVDIDAPNRKNLLPLSISEIKTRNTGGTWAGNVYTLNGITFTINTDTDGNITSVVVTGTATAEATMIIVNSNTAGIKTELNNKIMILSGCPAGGSSSTYNMFGWHVTTNEGNIRDTGDGAQFNGINTSSSWNFAIIIGNGYEIPSGGLTFYPMLRLSTVSDATFAPYIPSVESRIEAVESGVANLIKSKSFTFVESDITENCLVTDIPRTATVIGVNCTNRVGWNLIPRIGVSGSVSSNVWVITEPSGTLSGDFTIVVGYVQL